MTDMNTEMTLDETIGVEAIAYLNGTIGYTEPKWVTLKNWRALTDEERKFAIDIAKRYKEVEEENDRRIANLSGNDSNSVSDIGDVAGDIQSPGNFEAEQVQP